MYLLCRNGDFFICPAGMELFLYVLFFKRTVVYDEALANKGYIHDKN